jgi:hypothetical protein
MCNKPALGAQMCFVHFQNAGQWRTASTRQASSWDYVLTAQMIEKLLHGFRSAPALPSSLALEKCLHSRLIKARD